MRVGWVSLLFSLLLLAASLGCTRNTLDRAQQYEIAGNNASALQLYQEALARVSQGDSRKRSEILLRIGDCLYRLDRPQEAFSTFQKAADTDHNNVIAHLRMGELFLSAGSPERAREQAMMVLSAAARNSEALALMGAAWAATDNQDLAKQAYERALQNDPKRVTVAVALADIYRRENNEAKAEEILKEAVKSLPGSSLPWLALGRLAEQQGNGSAAEDAYRRAVGVEDTPETNLRMVQFLQRSGRIAEAEQVLRKVDAQRPTYPVALADFEFSSGRPDQAVQRYQTFLTQSKRVPESKAWLARLGKQPSQSSHENCSDIVARLIEAEIATLFDRPADDRTRSVAATRTALNENRSLLDAASLAVLQAELAVADNNLVQARSYAATAKHLAPESPSVRYVSGVVAAVSGDNEAAEAEWQGALDNDSHFGPARLALADLALRNGDAGLADEQSRAVVRDDPGNVRAVIIFSRALLKERKLGAAAIMAQRAMALSPMSPDPAIVLGEIALLTHDLPHAMLNFERAIVARPNSDEAIDGLLKVYRNTHLSLASVRKLELAAQQPPASGTLLEITGRLYADRGSLQDAIRAMRLAVKVDPARATAATMLSDLQARARKSVAESRLSAVRDPEGDPLVKGYDYQQSGQWQNATLHYEKTLRQGDPTGVAANNLAWIYAEHETQLDRALSLAESAARVNPNSPAVLDTLGFVHLHRREYSEAVKQFETAERLAKVEGNDGEVRLQIRKHLHDAYLSAGQTEAAEQIAMTFRQSNQ